MFADYLDAVRRPDQQVNPIFAFLGVKVEHVDAERAALRLPYRPEFLQGAGSMAGGLHSLLLDEAMAHVAIAACRAPVVTMDLTIRYLRGAPRADLLAEARIVRQGRRVVVTEGELRSPEGVVLSRATGSFLVREAE